MSAKHHSLRPKDTRKRGDAGGQSVGLSVELCRELRADVTGVEIVEFIECDRAAYDVPDPAHIHLGLEATDPAARAGRAVAIEKDVPQLGAKTVDAPHQRPVRDHAPAHARG